MSLKYMVDAFSCKIGGTPLTKLVLLKLADNSNDSGICWPSYNHIADQCECSRRAVIAQVKKLIDMGYVEVVQKGNSHQKKSNKYRLHMDGNAPAKSDLTSEQISPAVNLTSEPSAPTSEPFAPVTSEPFAPQSVTLRTSHRTIDDDEERASESFDPVSSWLKENPGVNPYENDWLDQHARTEFEMHEHFEPYIEAKVRRQFTGMGIMVEEIEERLVEYVAATMIGGSKRSHRDWSNAFARSVLNFSNKNQRGNHGTRSKASSGRFDAGAKIVGDLKNTYDPSKAF